MKLTERVSSLRSSLEAVGLDLVTLVLLIAVLAIAVWQLLGVDVTLRGIYR